MTNKSNKKQASEFEDISERKKAEKELLSQTKFIDNLFEGSALSTWISDENGTAIRTNPACLEFFGAKAEEVVGKYNVFKDEVLIKLGLISELKKAYEKAEVVSVIIDYNFGEVKHVSVENATHKVLKSIFTPITDDSGKVQNVICQTMDLTDIKKADQALLESEEKFRNMTEQVNDMIFLTDEKGLLKYISSASNEIFGYTPQEMEGQLFMKFLKKTEIPKAVKQFMKTLISNSPTMDMVLNMKHKSGNVFIGELRARKFETEKHKGTIGVIRDITKRKETEKELEKHRMHLEDMVGARTKELKEKNKELERYNKLFVGREFRIKELRDEVEELKLRIKSK